MPRKKKALSPAERAKEYRKRKKAEADGTTDPKTPLPQMSRAAGVPRIPIEVWRRAAEALITGDGDIDEKVQLLRARCAVDKACRKTVKAIGAAETLEAVKRQAVAKGWAMQDTAVPAAKTPEEDAAELAALAALVFGDRDAEPKPDRTEDHLCNHCGGRGGPVTYRTPSTDEYALKNGYKWFHYWCEKHVPAGTAEIHDGPIFPTPPVFVAIPRRPAPTRIEVAPGVGYAFKVKAAPERVADPHRFELPDGFTRVGLT